MTNPYEILGIETHATPSQLSKAYKELTLRHHPDSKNGNLKTYLSIKKAYETLLNKVEFNSLYINFKDKYLNSNEEHDDLARLYINFKGNIKKIIDNHILCEYIDEERIRTMIEKMISEDKLERFKEFKKRIPKRLKVERKQGMEKMIGEMLANSEKKRLEFVEELERKYVNNIEYKK